MREKIKGEFERKAKSSARIIPDAFSAGVSFQEFAFSAVSESFFSGTDLGEQRRVCIWGRQERWYSGEPLLHPHIYRLSRFPKKKMIKNQKRSGRMQEISSSSIRSCFFSARGLPPILLRRKILKFKIFFNFRHFRHSVAALPRCDFFPFPPLSLSYISATTRNFLSLAILTLNKGLDTPAFQDFHHIIRKRLPLGRGSGSFIDDLAFS